MEEISDRYSRLPDGRVLDTEPESDGKPALVFDPRDPSLGWVVFEGLVGQVNDSIPSTEAEAAEFTAAWNLH